MDAANQSPQAPVDMARLKEFTDGTFENLKELIQIYTDQTEIYLVDLKKAAETGEREQVRRIAHSAAGSSATCGMTALAAFLRKIETTAAESRLEESIETLPHALAEYDRVKAYLTEQTTR
jgi:HPt (histidine-containing phosphotransfer) domain-containing protein